MRLFGLKSGCGECSVGLTPSTPPSKNYASSIRVLPYIPVRSNSHSVHTSISNDKVQACTNFPTNFKSHYKILASSILRTHKREASPHKIQLPGRPGALNLCIHDKMLNFSADKLFMWVAQSRQERAGRRRSFNRHNPHFLQDSFLSLIYLAGVVETLFDLSSHVKMQCRVSEESDVSRHGARNWSILICKFCYCDFEV